MYLLKNTVLLSGQLSVCQGYPDSGHVMQDLDFAILLSPALGLNKLSSVKSLHTRFMMA